MPNKTEKTKLVKKTVFMLWSISEKDWFDEPWFDTREQAQEYVDGCDWSWCEEEDIHPPIVMASYREVDEEEEYQ